MNIEKKSVGVVRLAKYFIAGLSEKFQIFFSQNSNFLQPYRTATEKHMV